VDDSTRPSTPRGRAAREIVLFGLAGGTLLAVLKLTEYRFLVVSHAVETYAVLVAALFDKLDVVDFNTVDTEGPVGFAPATGVPRIDWLGALITGYGNRPYTGSTFSLRALYRF